MQLNTTQDIGKVYDTIKAEVQSQPGENTTEKVTSWMSGHKLADRDALSEFAREVEIPSDPREAFLIGATFGSGVKERV